MQRRKEDLTSKFKGRRRREWNNNQNSGQNEGTSTGTKDIDEKHPLGH